MYNGRSPGIRIIASQTTQSECTVVHIPGNRQWQASLALTVCTTIIDLFRSYVYVAKMSFTFLSTQTVPSAVFALSCMSSALMIRSIDMQVRMCFKPGMETCRVVMTPHVAGVTELSYRTMAQVVADEVRRHAKGLPPTIQLNSISKAVPDAL